MKNGNNQYLLINSNFDKFVFPIDVFIPSGLGGDLPHYSQLLKATNATNKSSIQLNGKTLLEHVVESLISSKSIKSIYVGGNDASEFTNINHLGITFVEGGVTPFETYLNGIKQIKQLNPSMRYILIVSSDIPLITAEMVDKAMEIIDFEKDLDLYFNVVRNEDKLRVYPEARKSIIKLRDEWIHPGDFSIFKIDTFLKLQDKIRIVIEMRKNLLSILKNFSLPVLVKYKLHRLSIGELLKISHKKYNINAAFWFTQFPEPCIDLDYESDLAFFEKAILSKPRSISKENVFLITKPD